jgi:hypothetical protein
MLNVLGFGASLLQKTCKKKNSTPCTGPPAKLDKRILSMYGLFTRTCLGSSIFGERRVLGIKLTLETRGFRNISELRLGHLFRPAKKRSSRYKDVLEV